jgi:hypothetical protein
MDLILHIIVLHGSYKIKPGLNVQMLVLRSFEIKRDKTNRAATDK